MEEEVWVELERDVGKMLWAEFADHLSHPASPHKVDAPEEVPGWDVGGLFPNGDYTIFVSRDRAFGILGHPWERSLCVFGEPAVAAFEGRNRGVLTTVLRRDGRTAS